MKHKLWMILFFTLILINLIIVVIVASFFNQDYEESDLTGTENSPQALTFILPNQTIETLINDNLPYENFNVEIDTSGVTVNIESRVLGIPIRSSVRGAPIVDGDNIVIPLTDLNLADLPLSEDTLYSALKTFLDLPEGITMADGKKELIIDTKIFEQYFGISLQVDKIDYEADTWYFSINNIF
ncbi:DUF2140 family protein [Jeotgalicoccus marinus]|uniref:DUF2140 family protein n=1 Tax=Jeotgalicoccus marinus TaxID=516700 RepID=UPI0004275EB3|nr:DUF2140 family protein [Jeotgalicoccus marinus]